MLSHVVFRGGILNMTGPVGPSSWYAVWVLPDISCLPRKRKAESLAWEGLLLEAIIPLCVAAIGKDKGQI